MPDSGTVIITGAAGTIGEATARMLGGQGYSLVLVDTQREKIKALSATLPSSRWVSADVTDASAMKALFDSAKDDLFGAVLAAGSEGAIGLLEDCSDEAFEKVMRINVWGVWQGLKCALPILKRKKRGSIVVLSSISGLMAAPLLSSYGASKHAVTGLVRAAAREAAASGVRVNAVCPGPVQSDMMQRIDSQLGETYPERLKCQADASHSVPMQRYAQPQEVAGVIAFLCSDASRYCTGATLTVDGGISCR